MGCELWYATYLTWSDVEHFSTCSELKTAANLLEIANSENITLIDGLSQELENLEKIFATADALEGLSALIEGRRPSYTNS